MKLIPHTARRLALFSPFAVLLFAGCNSASLRGPTSEYVSPATSVVDGHTWVNPRAAATNRAPFYPVALRRDGVEGLVNVNCVVDANGRVLFATIADSTNRAFNRSTLETVRDWTFAPGTRDGVPLAMLVNLPVGYVMER